jgi:hypothetical protein
MVETAVAEPEDRAPSAATEASLAIRAVLDLPQHRTAWQAAAPPVAAEAARRMCDEAARRSTSVSSPPAAVAAVEVAEAEVSAVEAAATGRQAAVVAMPLDLRMARMVTPVSPAAVAVVAAANPAQVGTGLGRPVPCWYLVGAAPAMAR